MSKKPEVKDGKDKEKKQKKKMVLSYGNVKIVSLSINAKEKPAKPQNNKSSNGKLLNSDPTVTSKSSSHVTNTTPSLSGDHSTTKTKNSDDESTYEMHSIF